MRKLSFLLMAIAFGANAQQAEPLIFSEKTHDFGSVQENGGSVSTEFMFLNNSGRPIKILDVKPSCGCTTPEWTREVIEHGKNGVIKASFDPRGKVGYFNKSIAVTTDYGGAAITLAIKGNVETKLADPELNFDVSNGALQTKVSIFNLGKLFINQENGLKSFDIKNSSKNLLTFKEVKAPVYIKVQTPAALKAGEEGAIKILYDAKAHNQYGFSSDNIEIVTDDALGAVKSFSVFATIEEFFPMPSPAAMAIAPTIQLETHEIKFGEMFETGTLQRDVIFRNTGKSDLNIRAVQPNCVCIAAEAALTILKPGETSKIKITFNPKGRPGIQNKSITVYSNDPRNPVQRITLAGYVR